MARRRAGQRNNCYDGRVRAARFLCLLLLVSCGDEPSGPRYEGTTGAAVAISLEGWVPRIEAVADGAPITVMIDTGSPITVLALPSRPPGEVRLELRAFGLTFPDLPAVVSSLFTDDGTCDPPHPDGLLGGDLLRAFRLGLDYRGERAFLFDGADDDPPVAAGTEGPVEVPIDVLGGGLARLDDVPDPVAVEATRIAVTGAAVEGSTRVAVVDTGASLTVVSAALLKSLGESGRPSLCCETVSTIYGEVSARLSRLRQLTLGGVTVKSLPVLVWDQPSFFGAISAEVGRDVQLLVGGSYLRRFAVKVDYRRQRLELARYRNQDHVDEDEFVGPGFTLCRPTVTAEGMVVVDVFQGTDAETQGVRSGDRLLSVDGQSVVGLGRDEARTLLQKAAGSTVNLVFANNVKKTVKVERLLADY